MTMEPLDTLAHGPLAADLGRLATSLWVLPGADRIALEKLAGLPWVNVWNFDEGLDFATICPKGQTHRQPVIVEDIANDPETFNARLYVRIYQRPSSANSRTSPAIERIRRDQLKARAEYVGGTLFIVGDPLTNGGEIDLINELAPLLKLCLLSDTFWLGLAGTLSSERIYLDWRPRPFRSRVFRWCESRRFRPNY